MDGQTDKTQTDRQRSDRQTDRQAHASVQLFFRYQSILPFINSFVKSSDGPISKVVSECLPDDISFGNCLSDVVKLQFQLSKHRA